MSIKNIKLSQPTYEETVPSTGKKVKMTPFRVGDEKTLLIASQSNSMKEMNNALRSVVSNCVKGVSVEELEQYDLEYLFLKLRAKSVGETSKIAVPCESCGSMNEITVNLETVIVEKKKDHKSLIKIEDTLGFEMRMPDVDALDAIDFNNPSDVIKLVAASIKTVYSGDEAIEVEESDKEDLVALIESMTTDQFERLQEYFTTIPKLTKEIEFVCGSCSHDNNQILEGLASFF